MACDLTRGRLLSCKDQIGGIVRVYFIDYGDLGDVTLVDDEITTLSGTFNAYQYDLKGTNSLETTITSSTENGTTFFEEVLTLSLPKLSKADNKELKLMAYNRYWNSFRRFCRLYSYLNRDGDDSSEFHIWCCSW
jgi:hypothetical protein